jgi:hypothetical protein
VAPRLVRRQQGGLREHYRSFIGPICFREPVDDVYHAIVDCCTTSERKGCFSPLDRWQAVRYACRSLMDRANVWRHLFPLALGSTIGAIGLAAGVPTAVAGGALTGAKTGLQKRPVEPAATPPRAAGRRR